MGVRGIWLVDTTGKRFEGPMAHGLPTEVWRELYNPIMSNPVLPLLQRIWRDQWGPEGDVPIALEEMSALRGELAQVLPGISSPDARTVLERLVALTQQAEAQGAGLLFFAE
ncbi:hypothetical protein JQX13_04095 [Archangium violaceum]|uniref:hypothetical protein n=1 Tax=Archangium violaceum TaxID=83451 RepID=UPI00193C6DF4|nr:hypothetical protein [Archangium violaceum]QRK09337.1 hypothetical protein JQX13_04095 [Archangium violaceum]